MAKDIRVALELDSRQFDRGINKSTKEVQELGATGSRTSNILRTLAGAFAVREIVQFGDSITNLKNKLLTLNPNAQEVALQFDRIRQIAIDSRSDLDGVGDLYFRIARAQDELGITSEETASIVESVSKAITASGLSAQEAQGPLLQLGQALQSGKFQGDELRSILEGLPDVARALARTLNVPIGKLKELGSQGLITGDIFVRAMKEAKGSIDEAFANTDVTIGQGFSVVRTSFAGLVETIADTTGIFDSIANSLVILADFVERLSGSGDAIRSFGKALLFIGGSAFILRKGFVGISGGFKDLSKSAATSAQALRNFYKNFMLIFEKGFVLAGKRLTGFVKIGTPLLTLLGRMILVVRSLGLVLAGPVGLALAFKGVQNAISGIQDLKESDIIRKIAKQGKEATIKAINEINEKITELQLRIQNPDLKGSFLLDIMNIKRDQKELEKLEKRVDELYKTIDDLFVGPRLPEDHPIAIMRKEADDAAKAAKALQTEITNFMLSLGEMTRDDEDKNFLGAIARLNELMGDPKTNEQFLEYEKNLNTIYRMFGKTKPKNTIAEEIESIRKSIAKVDDFEDFNSVMGKIQEAFDNDRIQDLEDYNMLVKELKESFTQAEIGLAVFQNAIKDIDTAIADDLTNAIFEGENAIDSLKATFKEAIKQMIADTIRLMVVQTALQAIFGFFGYSATFAPSGGVSNLTKTKRQFGGPVMKNKPYIVGEDGPELFMPKQAGDIVPNGKFGGAGAQQNVTYNIQAVDAPSFQALVARDPDFIHAVASRGAQNMPSGRRF